jgi:hypothetical protein
VNQAALDRVSLISARLQYLAAVGRWLEREQPSRRDFHNEFETTASALDKIWERSRKENWVRK